jgi:hypothetical protein
MHNSARASALGRGAKTEASPQSRGGPGVLTNPWVLGGCRHPAAAVSGGSNCRVHAYPTAGKLCSDGGPPTLRGLTRGTGRPSGGKVSAGGEWAKFWPTPPLLPPFRNAKT